MNVIHSLGVIVLLGIGKAYGDVPPEPYNPLKNKNLIPLENKLLPGTNNFLQMPKLD